MPESQIRFDDGAAYERGMGAWSRLAGEIFLDWLAPHSDLRWIDIGCGNGAFTELIVERCAPAEIQAIDPSEGQLAFARSRPGVRMAQFRHGDAMALPFAEDRFDAAVMALVIFFVPEPAKGVAEMARVVRPSGIVATYAWDMLGGGFPLEPIRREMNALGLTLPAAPRSDASLEWMSCGICGQGRVSRRSRRGRLRSGGPSLILMIFGRPSCCTRVSERQLQRWRPGMSIWSGLGCVRLCRRMPRDGSPTARAPMR